MPIYESSESDNETAPSVKLFGRERPMRDILGRGRGIFFLSIFTFVFGRNEGKCLHWVH